MRRLRDRYQPTPEDRARIWTKLHAAASSGAAPEVAPRASRGAWMASTCVVLALAGVGLLYGRSGDGRTTDAMSAAPSDHTESSLLAVADAHGAAPASSKLDDAIPSSEPPSVPASPAVPVSSLPSVSTGNRVATTAPSPPARRAAAVPDRAAPARIAEPTDTAAPVDTLEEETRLLRGAMRAADKTRALDLLEEHAARFPRGALAGERDVQRILALCALGRVDDAKARARSFLAGRAPDALTRRIDDSCVGR
ncbi:MAG: hypothetical protein KF850_25490 [Labilithrix sp.]|nr:hypothetical protein [Labilithrix sp.]